MLIKTITVQGINVEIHYTINGKFIPGDRETPDEYPEIVIYKKEPDITFSDKDAEEISHQIYKD